MGGVEGEWVVFRVAAWALVELSRMRVVDPCLQGHSRCVLRLWLPIDDYPIREMHLFRKFASPTTAIIWTSVPSITVQVSAPCSEFAVRVFCQILKDSADIVIDRAMYELTPCSVFAIIGTSKMVLIAQPLRLVVLEQLAV